MSEITEGIYTYAVAHFVFAKLSCHCSRTVPTPPTSSSREPEVCSTCLYILYHDTLGTLGPDCNLTPLACPRMAHCSTTSLLAGLKP